MSIKFILVIILFLFLVGLSYVNNYLNNIYTGIIAIFMILLLLFIIYYLLTKMHFDNYLKMDSFMKIIYFMYKLDFIKILILFIIFIAIIILSIIKPGTTDIDLHYNIT